MNKNHIEGRKRKSQASPTYYCPVFPRKINIKHMIWGDSILEMAVKIAPYA